MKFVGGDTKLTHLANCDAALRTRTSPWGMYRSAPLVYSRLVGSDFLNRGTKGTVKKPFIEYPAHIKHPNRSELNSATALVEHSNRTN